MRIGKILVDSDSETHEAHVVFAKMPDDIANRYKIVCYFIFNKWSVNFLKLFYWRYSYICRIDLKPCYIWHLQ